MISAHWRYVISASKMWRHHRLQGLLSVLGVVAGVSGLVTAVAIGQGARQELDKAIGLLGAGTMMVRSIADDGNGPGIELQRAKAVQRLLDGQLRDFAPVIARQHDAIAGDRYVENVKVVGTDRSYEAVYKLDLAQGRFITWYDVEHRERVCVLGWELGRDLFPRGHPVGQRVRLGEQWYTVVGWLESSSNPVIDMQGFELPDVDRVIYVPYAAMAATGSSASLDELVLNFTDEADMVKASGAVQRILEYGVDDPAFEYVMPIDLLRQKFRMQSIIRYLLTGITVVLLAVGGIGIMNVMLVNVVRRRPEIGLRRAVGAQKRDIIAQFVTESTLVSLAGGVVGVMVGALIAQLVSLSLSWPVAFGPGAAALGLFVSILLGISFGSYPALQAASVAPIKTLNQG